MSDHSKNICRRAIMSLLGISGSEEEMMDSNSAAESGVSPSGTSSTRSESEKKEFDFYVLVDIAKLEYQKAMGKLVEEAGSSLDMETLRALHESCVESGIEFILAMRPVNADQRAIVKDALDQLLVPFFSLLKPIPKKIDLGVGVYIDQNIVKIGIHQQSDNQWPKARAPSAYFPSETSSSSSESTGTGTESLTEIMSATPEIYFGDEGVLVGRVANYFRNDCDNRYFDIFEMVTSAEAKAVQRFEIKGCHYVCCTHEIIAAFFQKVFDSLPSTQNANLGKLIVTVPFLPLSLITQRITQSFNILRLGFNEIRVMSSLVTTAIASIENRGCSQKDLNSKSTGSGSGQYVIVTDIQRASFSMGIVLLRPHLVTVVASSRSCEAEDCEQELFKESHSNLYDGMEIQSQEKSHVQRIYVNAVERLLGKSNLLKKQAYEIIVAETAWSLNSQLANKHRPDAIAEMVFEILRDRIHVVKATLDVRPLLGASLLASSASGNETGSSLPSEMQVDDCIRFSHILTTRFEGYDRRDRIFSWKPLTFEIPQRMLSSPRSCTIELHQQYGPSDSVPCSGASLFQVCSYRLDLEAESESVPDWSLNFFPKTILIKIQFTVDVEDTYSLSAAVVTTNPGQNIRHKVTLTREDFEKCESACETRRSSEVNMLRRCAV